MESRRVGVTIGLTEDEAKSVQNQILGKETPDVRPWQVLRGAAIQLRERMARQLIFTPALVLLAFGQAVGLSRMGPVGLILLILAVPLLVVTYGWTARQFRQTGVSLDKASSGSAEKSD